MALAFSKERDRAIDDLLTKYPTREAALIPVLDLAQREFGYLSRNVMEMVAERLDLPPTHVIATATFYTMLNKEPKGRYHLQVCTNVSCFLRGADALVARLKETLDISDGETTKDGLFSLTTVQCLAACGTAPVIQVNDTYHEGMTVEKLDALVASLKKEAEEA